MPKENKGGFYRRANLMRKREVKPTINDVARIAGVSKKTVSRVINRSPLLNDTTREKVEEVIAQLGYVPNPQARALALRRNFLIGLIHDNPNAQTVLRVQEGMLDAMRDTEFALVVRPVDRNSPRLAEDIRGFLEQQRLHGVLVLPPVSERSELVGIFRELDCHYVRMGSARLDELAHVVESNDRQAVAAAVNHVIGLGHRRIAIVMGPEGFRSAYEREQGYRDAMAAHGLEVDPELAVRGTYRFESGLAAGRALMALDQRPTAVFASNDEMAAGVLHAVREKGLVVPDDVSLVGFDDTPVASSIWPPLTTVRWPIRAMARAAACKLLAPEVARDQQSFFESELVLRASTAAPKA
jgi:LacI family transcriptional regulator